MMAMATLLIAAPVVIYSIIYGIIVDGDGDGDGAVVSPGEVDDGEPAPQT